MQCRSKPVRWRLGVAAGVVAIAVSGLAHAEPWSDPTAVELPLRRAVGDTGLELAAEYRTDAIHLASYDLEGHRATWVEQRLRTHFAADHDETVRVVLDVDALPGILWGSGAAASSLEEQSPGLGRAGIVYRTGDRGDPASYDLGVVAGNAAELRHAYGEAWLPVGRLRVGRQATVDGSTVLAADGEGRANRFGRAHLGDTVDRIQLTLRPLHAFDADSQQDERGLSLSPHYDLPTQGDDRLGTGALHRVGLHSRYLAPLPTLEQLYDAHVRGSVAWGTDTDTLVGTVSTVLEASVYELSVGLEAAYLTGRTREISLAFAPLTGEPSRRQRIRQFGARFVARWDEPVWTAYLEVDYASGDGDPSPDSDLARFSFAPDANVGLLLFEHVLAYQSARSAHAAAAADTSPLPLTPVSTPSSSSVVAQRLDSQGAFTNAVAFFPQVDVRPADDWTLRGGVLLAWTADGLVDPLESLRARSAGGEDRNYRGGDPGFLYGVEFDGRVTWQYYRHFFADLEGALLLPGDALHDATGKASTAGLVQGRATFVF